MYHSLYTLGLVEVESFNPEAFPQYKSYGYRGLDKSFHSDQGTIHIFAKKPILTNFLYSPIFKHDLSFWLPKSAGHEMLKKDELSKNISAISDGTVIETEIIDYFYNEEKDLSSQTLRLTYFDDKKVLSPDDIMSLHYEIGNLLSKRINITVR